MDPEMIEELQQDAEYNEWLDQQEQYSQEQELPEDFQLK